jgi:hypothetical protein
MFSGQIECGGKFDVLQHPANDHRLAVGDAIHVHLEGFFEKFVHEHRPLR